MPSASPDCCGRALLLILIGVYCVSRWHANAAILENRSDKACLEQRIFETRTIENAPYDMRGVLSFDEVSEIDRFQQFGRSRECTAWNHGESAKFAVIGRVKNNRLALSTNRFHPSFPSLLVASYNLPPNIEGGGWSLSDILEIQEKIDNRAFNTGFDFRSSNPRTLLKSVGGQGIFEGVVSLVQGKILEITDADRYGRGNKYPDSGPYYRIAEGAFLFLCCGLVGGFGIVRIYNLSNDSSHQRHDSSKDRRRAAVTAFLLIVGWVAGIYGTFFFLP